MKQQMNVLHALIVRAVATITVVSLLLLGLRISGRLVIEDEITDGLMQMAVTEVQGS